MALRSYNKHCPANLILFSVYRQQFLSINEGAVYRLRLGQKTPFHITSSTFVVPNAEHTNLVTVCNFKLIFFGVLSFIIL